MSDKRPYTTSNIISDTSSDKFYHNILRHDTEGVPQLHLDDHTELFQNQEPQQLNTIRDQQQDTTIMHNVPDPSETATTQNVSEISDTTINNPQSLTITKDSIALQIPVPNITHNTISEQNQNDTIYNAKQDNTSTLSTSDTQITHSIPNTTFLTSN